MHFSCGKFAAKVVDSRQTKFGHNSHPKFGLAVWFQTPRKRKRENKIKFNWNSRGLGLNFKLKHFFNDI